MASVVKMKTPAEMADAYGNLLAEKADLAKREKALKEALFNFAKRDADGLLFINGSKFRVTISEVAPGKTLDTDAVKSLVPAALLKLCMKWKAGSLRFNAKARVAGAEAA